MPILLSFVGCHHVFVAPVLTMDVRLRGDILVWSPEAGYHPLGVCDPSHLPTFLLCMAIFDVYKVLPLRPSIVRLMGVPIVL